MPDIVDLLKSAANIFAELAEAYEHDNDYINERIDAVENKTDKNREALRAAESILTNLR